jgi:Pin2-interacting protein X1
MIAAKRMALSNSTALAEILGIPSSSTSSFTSPYMSTAATPTPTPAPGPGRGPAVETQEPLQQLTTSSQSVGDYFKAKLSTKRPSHPTLATADPPPVSAPTSSWDGGDDGNRAGLGSGGGASRVLLMDSLDEGRVRGGIGASSSKFAAMFTMAQPMTDTQEKNAMPAIEPVETHDTADLDDDRRKSDKKLAKEERRRKKEEKRRRRAGAGQVDDTATDMAIDETPVGQAKKKKRHERDSEDTQTLDVVGVEAIREKRREKHKKSAKCRRPKE